MLKWAQRILRTEKDREAAVLWIGSADLPCVLSLKKGAPRSLEQNHLQRMWMNEAAEQLGDNDAEGYRAYCKLHFGVPILRAEDDDFRDAYDKVIRPRTYEEKLVMMSVPLDFPVTRLMTTNQKSRYLDAVYHFFTTERGVQLTEPKR